MRVQPLSEPLFVEVECLLPHFYAPFAARPAPGEGYCFRFFGVEIGGDFLRPPLHEEGRRFEFGADLFLAVFYIVQSVRPEPRTGLSASPMVSGAMMPQSGGGCGNACLMNIASFSSRVMASESPSL